MWILILFIKQLKLIISAWTNRINHKSYETFSKPFINKSLIESFIHCSGYVRFNQNSYKM